MGNEQGIEQTGVPDAQYKTAHFLDSIGQQWGDKHNFYQLLGQAAQGDNQCLSNLQNGLGDEVTNSAIMAWRTVTPY